MKKKTIMAVLIGMTVNIRLQSIKMRMLRLLMRTQKMKGREMHFR